MRAVRSIGSNRTEVDHGDVIVLYSYDIPVAVLSPVKDVFVTMERFSTATSRHISQWVERFSSLVTVTEVPQSVIERMAESGSVHGVDTFEHNPSRKGKYDNDLAAIERQIVTAVVDALLGAGNALAVEDEEQGTGPFIRDRAQVLRTLFASDEDLLLVRGAHHGWVWFVYGNGWDVLDDYSVSLENVLMPVNELADREANEWHEDENDG